MKLGRKKSSHILVMTICYGSTSDLFHGVVTMAIDFCSSMLNKLNFSDLR
jgi:hypothetical protein